MNVPEDYHDQSGTPVNANAGRNLSGFDAMAGMQSDNIGHYRGHFQIASLAH